ncbi:hypothetical protein RDV64_05810 [Acuticoccus sp. MNP-M23]|uniref:hypothetical protein n=1 Tax=Acuticoccus sp. MNP-M23 TaxID=3072793 RepID=UPI002816589C|nr:hypothetical protein [Acuticoccus sp. MNP-M23]WMS43906.1 hypothetical protein RDV64_05810 [Acuticoccus sp. MNP-M23]
MCNFYIRPGFTLVPKQSAFDPSNGKFSLGDLGFDIADGQSFDSGLIAVAGMQGTVPTYTTISAKELRLGAGSAPRLPERGGSGRSLSAASMECHRAGSRFLTFHA